MRALAVLVLIPMALGPLCSNKYTNGTPNEPSSKDRLINDVKKRQLTHIDLTDLDDYITELENQVGLNNPDAQADLTYILLRLDKGDLEITKSGHALNVKSIDGVRSPWMSNMARLVHELALYPVSMHGLVKDIRKRQLTSVKDMSQLDWYLRELTTDLAELGHLDSERRRFLQEDFDYIQQQRTEIKPLGQREQLVLDVRQRRLTKVEQGDDLRAFVGDLEFQADEGDEQARADLTYISAFLIDVKPTHLTADNAAVQQVNESMFFQRGDVILNAANSVLVSEGQENGTDTQEAVADLVAGAEPTCAVAVE